MIERVCEVCHESIRDEDQWFRVREEYVHLSCAEKFLVEDGGGFTRTFRHIGVSQRPVAETPDSNR